MDFDTDLEDYVLTLSGTGFAATEEDTEVLIDEEVQPLISVSDTEVKVHIIHALDSFVLNTDFYLPIGLPEGLDNLTITTGFTMQPVLLKLFQTVASPAGSWITAIVKGIGANTKGVTLVNSTGFSICQIVKIPKYGVLQCKTKAGTLPLDLVSVSQNGVTFACQGTSDECSLQTSSTMPTLTSVSKVDSYTMQLTGTNFQ